MYMMILFTFSADSCEGLRCLSKAYSYPSYDRREYICLDESQLCNGWSYCADGSDEKQDFCPCPVTEFTCNAYNSYGDKCLNMTAVCDGVPHCIDGSDESFCLDDCPYDWLK